MKFTVLLSLLLGIFLNGCFEPKDKIIITANSWIGYSPLFYAREKGWLEDAGIECLSTTSLSESMHIYNSGSANVFTGTQHEFIKQREDVSDLIPIILFDRSNGGDAVLSNVPLTTLIKSNDVINVYLELDSVNEELLKHFIKEHSIPASRLKIYNNTQEKIALMEPDSKENTLIITYDPYNLSLIKKGFYQIADTRNDKDLIVLDALYVSSALYENNDESFKKLNALISKAITALEKDPKEYYESVKVYLDNPSYEEFQAMLENIEWIHGPLDQKMLEQLQQIDFPHKDVIQ